MSRSKPVKHPSLFIRSSPNAPQLSPELAKEIGLNESILLLQWEYWMRSEGEERDGFLWLRKPEREIQHFFTFWSTGSIHRILQSLVSKGYMVAGSYDSGPGRGAQWFRIEWEKISTLKSLKVDCSNLEQRLLHSEEKSLQSGASVLNISFKDIESSSANAEPPPTGYKEPKKTKTTLPPDFTVTDGMRNWAQGVGLSDDRIDNAHERYLRDAEKKCKRFYPEHWVLDWEEWMLREVSFTRNGNGHKREEEEWDYHSALVAPEKPVDYFEKIWNEANGK